MILFALLCGAIAVATLFAIAAFLAGVLCLGFRMLLDEMFGCPLHLPRMGARPSPETVTNRGGGR